MPEAGAELLHFTGFERGSAWPTSLFKTRCCACWAVFWGRRHHRADVRSLLSGKSRDRLYPEFVAGGVAERSTLAGREVVFESGDDLVRKTRRFRFRREPAGIRSWRRVQYAATRFGGFNLYMHAATKNVQFAKQSAFRLPIRCAARCRNPYPGAG